MSSMIPLIIVPFHDPAWLSNVEENLARQTVQTGVVLAVNGLASSFSSERWQVTQSGKSHAGAVNAGAAWARAQGGYTHAILMDSDDFYGPEYVKQALAALQHADYCGKRSVYTWLGDGLHLFERPQGKYMGGTLAFDVAKFVDMPVVYQDDTEWCLAMEVSGALGVDTGITEYCYVRHGANAHWRANDVIVRRAWGQSLRYPEASIHAVSSNPGAHVVCPVPSDAQIFASMQ